MNQPIKAVVAARHPFGAYCSAPKTGPILFQGGRSFGTSARRLSVHRIECDYNASELRDRITKSGVNIRIIDRTSRKELLVEPRKYRGRLIHGLPEARSPFGDLYVKLYITEPSPKNQIGLYRLGTHVLDDLRSLDMFQHEHWTSGYLEGLVDVPFIQLTPGTRSGVVFDDALASLIDSLRPVEEKLLEIIAAQRRAEEEEASRSIFRKVSRALKEAFMMLPREEYG
jgi:hypothetical protein